MNKITFNKNEMWFSFVLLALAGCSPDPAVLPNTSAAPTNTSNTERKAAQGSQKVSYRVFQTWSNEWNDKKFRSIVISPSQVNKANMRTLGEMLKKEDDENGEFDFTYVFSSESAAKLFRLSTDKKTDQQKDLQAKHWIGEFGKNTATGYRAFRIYYDEFAGVDSDEIVYNKDGVSQ